MRELSFSGDGDGGAENDSQSSHSTMPQYEAEFDGGVAPEMRRGNVRRVRGHFGGSGGAGAGGSFSVGLGFGSGGGGGLRHDAGDGDDAGSSYASHDLLSRSGSDVGSELFDDL